VGRRRGVVSGQYVWAHLLIGRTLLETGESQKALTHFEAAREYPHNLGEGKHLLTREAHLDYFADLRYLSWVVMKKRGRTGQSGGR